MKTLFVFASLLLAADFAIAAGTERINISAVSEGYLLNGEVVRNTDRLEQLPAIIFLVGSGGISSHTTDYKDFVHYFFEERLLDLGFAIVYFDKRGVGDSEGVWFNTTFEQRALDAKKIAIEVGELDFIDREQIYLVGHSQGGWIAQIALATWPELFSGAISMAGPTYGVRKQIVDEYHSRFICDNGMSEEAALKKATRNVNRDLFFISFLGWTGNWKQLRIIRDFEADGYISSITKPFLFMFAENDELVNPEWAMEELEKIFPDGSPSYIETYIADGQNHGFRIAPACYRGARDELKYSGSTRDKLIEWLLMQTDRESYVSL